MDKMKSLIDITRRLTSASTCVLSLLSYVHVSFNVSSINAFSFILSNEVYINIKNKFNFPYFSYLIKLI